MKAQSAHTHMHLQSNIFKGHMQVVYSVACSYYSRRVISGSGGHDNTLRIWEAETAASLHTLLGHISEVLSVAWSPDSTRVVSGSSNNKLRIWARRWPHISTPFRGTRIS